MCVCVCVCVCVHVYITRVCSDCICVFMILILMMYITLRACIASRMVMGSRYRGGIVNIRGGCSCVRLVQRQSTTELWRFRVKTSNNPSGHSWPPTDTFLWKSVHIYAQPGIRVCGDDHFELLLRQQPDSKAL